MSLVAVHAHPLLEVACLSIVLDKPLSQVVPAEALRDAMLPAAKAPMATDDTVRKAVRDLLRQGGYKPTGRGKPSSEYLAQTAAESGLPRINALVDAGNAASLHSGLPISVVDLDRIEGALEVAIAPKGSSYAFNASGQVIDLEGLLCLFDGRGPCANAVKDAQRTKTADDTRRALAVVWGTNALPGRAERAARWLGELLSACGATSAPAAVKSI
jgi:DNA/RNA-binding domain of Phe-tRNA-synthetase-like protein